MPAKAKKKPNPNNNKQLVAKAVAALKNANPGARVKIAAARFVVVGADKKRSVHVASFQRAPEGKVTIALRAAAAKPASP